MIKVDFEVCGTVWHITRMLGRLNDHNVLSFDLETKGVYTKEERKLARGMLDKEELTPNVRKLAAVVANNSGLSYPAVTEVTHFVFGLSRSRSVVLVVYSPHTEMMVWDWVAKYKGLLLIHNSLFDLKLMKHRVNCLPKNYTDTQLIAKTLINDANTWKAKVGLKDLMSSDYSPEWTLIEEYEPENLRDPRFLRYASIDGAATYKLWEDMLETMAEGLV